MLAEKLFNAGELTLNYAEDPASGPPLVLLHGLTHSWQTWENVIPELTSRWHVDAIDQRGHGKSGHSDQDHVIDYARDTVAFLRQLGEPAVLVGHSLGGLVALAVASAYPEGVRAMVLVDPALFLRNSSLDANPARKVWNVWLYETLKDNSTYEILVARCRSFLQTSSEAEIKSTADQHYGLAAGAIGALVSNQGFESLHLTDVLKKIECPTLLLQGDMSNGGAMRHEDADFVRENLPRVAIVFIPNGSHVYPRESAAIILQHVNASLPSV